MKNICFFNGDMSRNGGTEKCTALIANELTARTDHNIIIADISNKTEKCFFEVNSGIKTVHLHSHSISDGIKKFRRLIKDYSIDVVINVEAMLGIYSVPAAALTKTKNIIWEHGNFYQKQCSSIDIVRAIEMKLCDRYITLTETDKHSFEQHFKGRCRTEYIYNPIELPEENIEYKGNTKRILSVGLVRYIKGFDMLIEAANKVLSAHPDWTWDIYGSYDPNEEYAKQLIDKISKYGLHDRLVLRGSTKNISECYKNSDIMVMTSRMEGLPMTLLEAKSYKLPLVAFNIMTGPNEIIEDGINGYLIEPYDIDSMADKICALIENKQLRQRFSDNAYEGIDKFNIDEIMKKWIDVIEG